MERKQMHWLLLGQGAADNPGRPGRRARRGQGAASGSMVQDDVGKGGKRGRRQRALLHLGESGDVVGRRLGLGL